jgi:drug/metabolite transporter (DMT)-like permease
MIESVTDETRWPLIYRTAQGILTMFMLYNATEYLPLVQVALIVNLMPLFTAVLGYWYLREHLSVLEVVVLIVSFVGVAVLIAADSNQQDADDNGGSKTISASNYFIASILLIFHPIFNASGTIALR